MKIDGRIVLGIFSLIMIILISFSSALEFSNSTFNNSLSSENLTFTGGDTISRYLIVPENVYLTNVILNLTGYESELYANYFTAGGYNTGSLEIVGLNEYTRAGQLVNISSLTLDKVSFYFKKDSSPAGVLNYSIRYSNNTLVSTCFVDNATNIATSYTSYECDFVDVFLNGGYYISIERDNLSGGAIEYVCDDAVNISGREYTYKNNTGTWVETCSSAYEDMVMNITFAPQLYPTNSTLIFGTAPSVVWENNGIFNTTTTVTGTSKMVWYLNQCSYVNGFCAVPFEFNSSTGGDIGYSSMIFNNSGFVFNSNVYQTTAYETEQNTYSLNISYDEVRYSNPTVYLEYNGTNYTTTRSGSDNTYTFNYTMDLPIASVGNTSFRYIFTDGSEYHYTNTYYQTVNSIVWTSCNATYNISFLNVSFADETDLSVINASIPYSNFTYYLGSGSVTKYYSYINTTDHWNYTFCASPTNYTMNIMPLIQYKQVSDYPQRVWNPATQEYTNVSTNQTLYLLDTSTGTDVTFQVVNPSGQALSGVTVLGTRLVNGILTTVAYGTTDAAGSVNFFLDGDFQHTFTFTKDGFSTLNEVIFPTESEYTITMGASTAQQVSDYTRGIVVTINPIKNTRLYNGTSYNFNMTITTSYWDLDNFGYTLELINGTRFAEETSSTTTGGTLDTDWNTGNNYSEILMIYYYTVNGTQLNYSTKWAILSSNWDDWSIKNFFEDFTTYINDGIFGLDDFGVNLIVFFILFISVGIMSYKYGISSPMAVMTVLFGIVYFFDVTVDMLPAVRGIDNVYTMVAGFILAIVILREVTR